MGGAADAGREGPRRESRHLDLRAGEHQKDWYIKLNPRAVVPTLIDGDIVVPEFNVINEYLDERFPDPPKKPADPFGRARMRLWPSSSTRACTTPVSRS